MDILVAVDRSAESRNALVSAVDVVESVGGRVIAVHVNNEEEDSGETPLERAEKLGSDREVDVETRLLSGDPIQVIPDFARESGADAIYLGHRGLSRSGEEFPGETRGRLGSVARGVMEHSVIPVTVFDRGL